ncbi:MAG: hypothetical protein U5O16_41025 [Rhodococcus sp. (in: high G+C Gram-positive bacteria)]|uniref:hypothetical protein n=1 Tax=Rhodococcus sp. TaxID=1831 RepID=UPI002AD750A3|nr:hypothetical protein [Rhodococcus sp. (in: high G+C Gram-positive bacteria)]
MPGEGETIEVFPPATSTAVDRHGDTDAVPGSYEVEDVLIDWDGSMETAGRGASGARATAGGGRQVVTKVILICPEGAEISNGARVKLRDRDIYQVDGDPAPWRMGSWEPGVIVRLKGVK